jgi:hypothetical protein
MPPSQHFEGQSVTHPLGIRCYLSLKKDIKVLTATLFRLGHGTVPKSVPPPRRRLIGRAFASHAGHRNNARSQLILERFTTNTGMSRRSGFTKIHARHHGVAFRAARICHSNIRRPASARISRLLMVIRRSRIGGEHSLRHHFSRRTCLLVSRSGSGSTSAS